MYYVYILKTSGNTLYTGITNNLSKRIKEHKSKTKRSAKYMRLFKNFELIYTEKHLNRSSASKREIEIKKLTRKQKDSLIESV